MVKIKFKKDNKGLSLTTGTRMLKK